MQRATLGKSGSEAASQLQGRIAKAFSSNSLVNTMDMTAAIQYILTAAQSLGSRVYYKKFRMTILGLAGVLFWESEQALVRRISASFQYNCAKNGKDLKIGTKEADTT